MSRAHAACSVPKSHGQVVIPAAVVEALDACKQACRPGATYGAIFDDHAKALDNTGFGEHKQAERLRLQPGCPVPSNLDGLADDLCG
jgi:hypothetical protein